MGCAPLVGDPAGKREAPAGAWSHGLASERPPSATLALSRESEGIPLGQPDLPLIVGIQRFEEAKFLLRKTVPVAQRVHGENHDISLRMRSLYAQAVYRDDGATLDDLREAVTTLDEVERIARRVLGGAHPLTSAIEGDLRNARAALHAHESPPTDAREDGDLDEVEDA